MDYRELVTKHGGIRAAARAIGVPYTTFYGQIKRQLDEYSKAPKRVFYFTDTHDSPWMDKSHLYHIAKHIKNTNPDIIMHGGHYSCHAFKLQDLDCYFSKEWIPDRSCILAYSHSIHDTYCWS